VTGPALIAHVVYRLDVGGLENGLVNLVNRLPAERFRHAIICLAGYSDFRHRIRRGDVEVVSIDKRPGKDPAAYFRMRDVLWRLRPRILHTRNIGTVDMQWVGLAARIPARVHGEHGWTADDPLGSSRSNLRIRRACRPVIHHWVGMSRDIRDWLVRQVGIPPARVTQLYSGVDTERFRPEGARPADLPWRHDQGLITLGTVGRLDPVKNQMALVRGFHGILERHPELRERLRLIIVGGGPMWSELTTEVRQLGMEREVWLPGVRSDVADMMRAMDLFVLPSTNEGISNTVLEAMASALPVVAARVGGNPELIDPDRTGVLYDAADPSALASAVAAYVGSRTLRDEHGKAARERVLASFSIESMVDRYAEFYDRMLSTRN